MPPKKNSAKKSAKDDDNVSVSSNHSEPEKVIKKPTKTKQVKEQVKEPVKEPVKEQVKEQVKEKKWEEYCNSDNDMNCDNNKAKHEDDQESDSSSSLSNGNTNNNERKVTYQTKTNNDDRTYKKSTKHVTSSAIQFGYQPYRQLDSNVKDMTTPEILKLLIVRAHDDNQIQLRETLKQTLRAVHLECNFPAVDYNTPVPKRDDYRQHSYGGANSRPNTYKKPFNMNQSSNQSQQNSFSHQQNPRPNTRYNNNRQQKPEDT